jgi:holliday junction DNA helicase RuvB
MIKSSNKQSSQDTDKKSSKAKIEISELVIKQEGEKALRPSNIEGYIGQEVLKKQLWLIIESCKIRGVMPEHMLFYGPAGLGKTTISNLIATEIGASFRSITASSLQKVGDIIALLSNLEERTILFIDEIHRLKAPLEESLYSAMEDQKIDILIGKGNGSTTLRIDLPNITIIGATTLAGRLSKPLRDRFPSLFQLELYSILEMQELIRVNSKKVGLSLTKEAVILIAKRSRQTPRIANNIIKRFLDLQLVNGHIELDTDKVFSFFKEVGIYEDGLTRSDIKYLQALEETQLSLKTISGVLMEEVDTIEQVIEPYLLFLGLVDKDSGGRKLTPKGQRFIKSIYA